MVPDERPREKFLAGGPGEMSTTELLAILLRTGSAKESVIDLADRVLREVGGIREIALADIERLKQVHGIGEVKAIEIRAAIELGKRLLTLGDGLRPTIHSPADAAGLLMAELRYERQEHFKVLLLDSKLQVLQAPTITIGIVNASLVHPREVFRPALAHATVSIILAHNHPSGDPTPSGEDLEVTKQLVASGHILGIEVVDHVIIGDGRFVSLKERGLM